MKLKSIKNLYKPLLILGLSTMFCLQPITNVNAAKEANHGEGTSVTLEGLTFGEHNGCIFSISGEGKSYCIQRGYPFRSLVSDVDMSMVNGQTLLKWAQSQENFKGWGKWEINGDHTDATYKEGQSTKHIPSSGDSGDGGESSDSDEEGDVTSTTGTDGAKDTYSPKVTSITDPAFNFSNTNKQNALAYLQYYVYEDSDASGYSQDDKDRVMQALTWAVQYDFLKIGGEEGSLQIIAQDSCGKYKNGTVKWSCGATGNTHNYSSCGSKISPDTYINKYLNGYSDSLKLYRQVIWKITNMGTIPSFAYTSGFIAGRNPIHLKWDENEEAYIATINDENGVLKYFDFNINGVTCTENADGTLTIKSSSAIDGKITSQKANSTILPEDCEFNTPTFWRWTLEGKYFDWYYSEIVDDKDASGNYKHSHSYNPACQWKCEVNPNTVDSCSHPSTCNNCAWNWACTHTCTDSCANPCTHSCGESCKHYYCGHSHNDSCKHKSICPSDGSNTTSSPNSKCTVKWTCTKEHKKIIYHNQASGEKAAVRSTYIDWQDINCYSDGDTIKDPTSAYIAIVTDPHKFEAETNVEIKLIDSNGNVADHIKVGERYKLRYIYTYEGASKGFTIDDAEKNKTMYNFSYLTRMKTLAALKTLKTSEGASNGGNVSVPNAILKIVETNVTMRGTYETGEHLTGEGAYPETIYKFDSGTNWNDTIALDALVTEISDDGYTNKTATQVQATSNHKDKTYSGVQESDANGLKSVSVYKDAHNDMKVVWVFESDYEVFTSGIVVANAYIQVGNDDNYASDYFDEAFNYGNFNNHNYVGGKSTSRNLRNGYFGRHTVYTQNNEYITYSVKNKVYQSELDIEVSNPILNTGAGITQHTYSKVGEAFHDVNFNLYYTIKLKHDNAYIYERKLSKANDVLDESKYEGTSTTINTSNDKYEFDVNTAISFTATGGNLNTINLNTKVVDHISSGGNIYIQRVIPSTLTTLTSGVNAKATVSVEPNFDRLIYEDYYETPTKDGSGINSILKVKMHGTKYTPNKVTAENIIYKAMNPTIAKPQNINGSNNVNNTYSGTTSFNIKLSNDVTTSIKDSDTENYTQYAFAFNTSKQDNKVTFPSHRKSVSLFKYSNTTYNYNSKSVKAATGTLTSTSTSQTERYYISEILFKSNYTDKNNLGTNGWVDMVNDNANAIVSAGQGFELKVTVKYTNSKLTQYMARYFGHDDAQYASIGSSALENKTSQYCNISPLTGAKLSGFTVLDRLASKFVTGSNVYKDLYTFMSDNPNSVYSYSGIYNTPTIFDRTITYNGDYSVTTITYTMKKSTESGVASSFSNMKFYTNQLASDSETPGVVLNGNLPEGKHSITLWTPIIAATGFEYPNTIDDRYIGDAIEIGYTIKKTGADDNIGHIVQ